MVESSTIPVKTSSPTNIIGASIIRRFIASPIYC